MKDRKLHFIAIGGAGMSGLALVSHRLGAVVTGSDRSESTYLERLRGAGLDPQVGHNADAVPADAEVVISTAIAEDNPELALARERGQKIMHRSDLLAELCAGRRVIAIAGTHGKTTTSAMAIHALRETGVDPSWFLGGELPGAGDDGGPANAGLGRSDWVVVEADESDGSFLKLDPEIAVVTNVELDHHARWSGLAELTAAFAEFAGRAHSCVVGAGVDPAIGGPDAVGFRIDADGDSDGVGSAAVVASGLSSSADGISFTVAGLPGEAEPVRVALRAHGHHNVLNAIAALTAIGLTGERPGLPAEAGAALSSFPGVARRLEFKGRRAGARIYDDYAHHPTEVAATLQAAAELDARRVIAVFQPHLYSRTKALAPEFGAALAAADEVALLEIYPAREEPVGPLEGVTARWVAEAAADSAPGKPVWWLRDAETAERALGPMLREGDVLITIGAGDIFKLAEALVEEPA